jgi:cellulose synthase/poly-beta-1,6-N-acetylglucosamine synthase-like glycosyltransferase
VERTRHSPRHFAEVRAVPVDKEIIVVDDFSTDGTRELLAALVENGEAEDENGQGELRIILQPQHGGKGVSVRRALELARGEWIIVQDADLEYDPTTTCASLLLQKRNLAVVTPSLDTLAQR